MMVLVDRYSRVPKCTVQLRDLSKHVANCTAYNQQRHETKRNAVEIRKPSLIGLCAMQEDAVGTQPRVVFMHKCLQLECWPATAIVAQLHLAHINLSYVSMDEKSKLPSYNICSAISLSTTLYNTIQHIATCVVPCRRLCTS